MKRFRFLSLIICVVLLAGVLASCAVFNTGSGDSGGVNVSAEDSISEDAAKDIVLARVPGAVASDFTRFEKQLDDGHWIYGGELVYKGIEYKFEIDGCSGNILEWELDN